MLTFEKDCDIIIIVNKRNIKISTEELQETSRTASGVKGIDIKDNEEALDLLISIGE
jgi:DNA gyrase/topoisomerase IV subunit A